MGWILTKIGAFVSLLLVIGSLGAQTSDEIKKSFPIIPSPKQMIYRGGTVSFESIFWSDTSDRRLSDGLNRFFKDRAIPLDSEGLEIHLVHSDLKDSSAYQLEIAENVTIKAGHSYGFWYGLQSLFQLFRKDHSGRGILPKVVIYDAPSFGIRGFMHDTGRNYQSLEQLKEQIEILALYKYNVFHWHLTDNPAWRLESKLYPFLTDEENFTRNKGAFYTQKEFLEIVQFCKDRFITVIPEFDIPGHTEAFRRAFGIDQMKEPQTLEVLKNLFSELMDLVDPADMPYIHIGTDEVRNDSEWVPNYFLEEVVQMINDSGRKAIVWRRGMEFSSDSDGLIHQLWANYPAVDGYSFIDSRSNYINHLDPLAGVPRLFFQQPCRQKMGDSLALGGILCAWPDNAVGDEMDILRQNPIYPALVFYSDAIWSGRERDYPEYWAQLPLYGTTEWRQFADFENDIILHRDLFFQGKPFPYVKQQNLVWSLIGPFDHQGILTAGFQPEKEILPNYTVGDTSFQWSNGHVGGTIHLNHFFGFPSVTDIKIGTYYAATQIYSEEAKIQSFWIGFQGWSRSGRRGGPTAAIGEWHKTKPKVWVNQKEIHPPNWRQPRLGEDTSEIPFVDEDYFYRVPTQVPLKKGWNAVLLKIPNDSSSWKWMFTLIPVEENNQSIKEASSIQFNPRFAVEKN
jgi:hypothetical protein